VTVRTSTLTPVPISVGDVVSGSIRSPGDVVAYSVFVDSFDTTTFEVTPSVTMDAQVTVVDSFGYTQVSDDVTKGEPAHVCSEGGFDDYVAVVSGAAGTVGEFRLAVETVTESDTDALAQCYPESA
jgi:hypothetical protein